MNVMAMEPFPCGLVAGGFAYLAADMFDRLTQTGNSLSLLGHLGMVALLTDTVSTHWMAKTERITMRISAKQI
jgi:hypothetical protein